MSNLVVLAWDRTRVAAVQIASGEAGKVSAAWSASWPENIPGPQSFREAGQWLRSQWTAAGLTAGQVWVVVPREDVVLRHLELPAAPDDELPDLVRFQAAGRSTVPLEQMSLDFVPLSPVAEHAGRDVLAATMPRVMTEQIQRMMEAAERELVGISFSSSSLAEWGLQVQRRQSPGQTSAGESDNNTLLVVGREGNQLELAVVCGRELTFAHSSRIPVTEGIDSTPAVLAEISRTLVAGQRLRPGLKVTQGWLVGADVVLAQALATRLECDVQPVDPISSDPQADHLQKLQGQPLLAATLLGVKTVPVVPRVNFIKPRQAPPKRDPRKRIYAASAAAALLLGFLIVGGGVLRLQSLDRQITERYRRSTELQEAIDLGKPVMDGAAVMNDWQARNINQLQLLGNLEATMPGGYERPYLAEFDFAISSGDTVAKIAGVGAAKSRADVETLLQDLRHQAGYQVMPKEVTTSRDPEYPQRFVLELNRFKGKPAAAAPAVAGATPKS